MNGGRDRFSPLDSSGFPLRICAAGGYRNETVAFEPGSLLFLYSDALVEGADARPEIESDELRAILDATAAAGPSQNAHERIVAHFRAATPEVMHDDLTLVAMRNCWDVGE